MVFGSWANLYRDISACFDSTRILTPISFLFLISLYIRVGRHRKLRSSLPIVRHVSARASDAPISPLSPSFPPFSLLLCFVFLFSFFLLFHSYIRTDAQKEGEVREDRWDRRIGIEAFGEQVGTGALRTLLGNDERGILDDQNGVSQLSCDRTKGSSDDVSRTARLFPRALSWECLRTRVHRNRDWMKWNSEEVIQLCCWGRFLELKKKKKEWHDDELKFEF